MVSIFPHEFLGFLHTFTGDLPEVREKIDEGI